MREIKLTQSKVAIVDDEDFENLNRFKWYACKSKGRWIARRYGSTVKRKQIVIIMHRLIMRTPEGLVTDHRNGNSLDNRKENLRNCTHSQNNQNRKKCNTNNSLGIKGVSTQKNKFVAKIRLNGKLKHFGRFNVLGDADSAYRIAEEKYFGIFAR